MKTSRKDKIYMLLAIGILGGILNFSLVAYRTHWLAGDEAVFIRITEHLPAYKSYAEWWTRDGITDPDDVDYLPPSTFYHDVMDTPIWRHPPLANYLAWPAVKLLMNEESVATIDESVVKLRFIAWGMLTFSMLSATYLTRRKDKSGVTMLLIMLPLAAGYALFTQVGSNWFYHDTFMLVFLMIALLMRKTKYEKFIYIPLAMMVATKITAVLFLIPFIIENRKTILCSLVLVPYLIQTWVVTGNPLWIIQHWVFIETAVGATPSNATPEMIAYLLNILKDAASVAPFLAIISVPFAYIVYNAIRKRGSWFFPVLFVVASAPTIGWAFRYWEMLPLYYYQMLPMLIIGMLITGEAVTQYKTRRAK